MILLIVGSTRAVNLLLLGPDGIGIDRRGGELGMTEPLLH